ncbi:MAG: helicase-related protein, partial [Microvirga sp.]
MARRSLPPQVRARGVTAVLGPTNTGKTHLAIERMLGHDSGMIGLPLRLLAREVYNRVVEKAGHHNVALITGEEKIKPDRPRYWISTVEAMPRDLDLAFVAVDEIQLASDLDRGHVFTDRLLNQRGREETLLIGSATMRPLIEALIPGVHVVTRPRLSKLSFAGEKKVSRLPRRSAIVAFSAEEVYGIAELIRRQSGGAAVVLGALSPRTRNAQVELFQNGDVDYLIATDAIGMGLNLDVNHVAFASDKKFDGFQFRKLNNPELAQIAGRAGRYMRDGTFGSTGRCPPFDAETVEALENHVFDPVRILQ